jgi:hypothetical protein
MVPNEILSVVRQRPFEPFRLWLSDGGSYDVRSPELCMVGAFSVTLGLTARAGDELYERTVKFDVAHIIRIEPLPASNPPQAGNGQAATGGEAE